MGDGGGGFFRGTSIDQDRRFSDKDKKLMKSIKFPAEYDTKVNIRKVKVDLLVPWISSKLNELLGFDDDIVVGLIPSLLTEKDNPDPRHIHIQITGFLGEQTTPFLGALWKLLISAQNSTGGVPAEFLQQKKDELRQNKAEQERIAAELRKLPNGPSMTLAAAVAKINAQVVPDIKKESKVGSRDRERDRDRDRDYRDRDRDHEDRDRDRRDRHRQSNRDREKQDRDDKRERERNGCEEREKGKERGREQEDRERRERRNREDRERREREEEEGERRRERGRSKIASTKRSKGHASDSSSSIDASSDSSNESEAEVVKSTRPVKDKARLVRDRSTSPTPTKKLKRRSESPAGSDSGSGSSSEDDE